MEEKKEKPRDTHIYDDIIQLPHYVSPVHPQMSMMERAAQFASFKALSGHEDAVRETARITDEKIELDEYETAFLDSRLQWLWEHRTEYPEAAFTFFCPDEKKEGGSYQSLFGRVQKIDRSSHTVLMENGETISFEQITKIWCGEIEE